MQQPDSILIVDDDPDFLELLNQVIGHIDNVRVYLAHTPREALQQLEDRDFGLIVSDWAIEHSTGPEVLRQADELRATPAEKTPVLFISGSEKVGQTRDLHSLKNFDPVSFVRKSCGTPVIGMLAEQILARAKAQGETVCSSEIS